MKNLPVYLFNLMILLVLHSYVYSQVPATTQTAVAMKVSTDNKGICPDKKEAYLYIDLKAASGGKRVPLNISIVLDRSGSMEEEHRLQNARIALAFLIDHLTPEDICSIVIYDHVAEVFHGATPVNDKEQLKKKLQHITARGMTNIYMGLQLGYEEVKANYSPDKLNRVILLSDGLANQGVTDDYLLELIAKDHFQRENITLSTFGMGHEFNEKLMHNLAEYGGGNYYFVEKPDQAINDFGFEIRMMLGIVAKQAVLKITYPSALKLNHVFGTPFIGTPGVITIDLKEVHPDEQHGILLKFNFLQPIPDSVVFNTTLTYIDINTNAAIKNNITEVIRKLSPEEDCMQGFNQNVIEKVVLYSSNYYLDSAADHAEKGNYDLADQTLEDAKKMHLKYNSLDPTMKQQSDLINEYQTELKKHRNAHPHSVKLLHKRIRHKNYKIRKGKCPQM